MTERRKDEKVESRNGEKSLQILKKWNRGITKRRKIHPNPKKVTQNPKIWNRGKSTEILKDGITYLTPTRLLRLMPTRLLWFVTIVH